MIFHARHLDIGGAQINFAGNDFQALIIRRLTFSSRVPSPSKTRYALAPSIFSRPRPLVALACGSRSNRRTRCPSAARQAERFTAVVVFPTPPFWLATGKTPSNSGALTWRNRLAPLCRGAGRSVSWSSRAACWIGDREPDWCWDNELPAHPYYLGRFALSDRLVNNREYLEFIEDGGYRQQLLWLDNGWSCAEQQGWQSPLYWEHVDGEWWLWTLAGMQPLAAEEPVCHASFYEADAFARWKSQTFASCRGACCPVNGSGSTRRGRSAGNGGGGFPRLW